MTFQRRCSYSNWSRISIIITKQCRKLQEEIIRLMYNEFPTFDYAWCNFPWLKLFSRKSSSKDPYLLFSWYFHSRAACFWYKKARAKTQFFRLETSIKKSSLSIFPFYYTLYLELVRLEHQIVIHIMYSGWSTMRIYQLFSYI